MTKAERIRQLHAQGESNTRIADIVDCDIGYVSVVLLRQRQGGMRDTERKHLMRKFKTTSVREAFRRHNRHYRSRRAEASQ